jgi:cAMP-dependent protein kinase regulator
MKNNFLFASLNPKDKKAVLDAIVGVKKRAGEVVIKQGDDGDNFYLVEAGELTCSRLMNPDDKEDSFLLTYVPGESFGELALLYNAPRAATIVAKSDCEQWSLERMTFSSIIKTAV